MVGLQGWKASRIWSEGRTKIDKINKNVELYQFFLHHFLFQNAWIFLLYILFTRRINRFSFKGIENVNLELWNNLGSKIAEEKLTKFIKFLELYQMLIHIFLLKNTSISPNHILLTRTRHIFTNLFSANSMFLTVNCISLLCQARVLEWIYTQ